MKSKLFSPAMKSAKLKRMRYPGLQLKFLLGLAVILLFFCFFSSSLIYFYQKNTLQEHAFRQTELVMSVVNATRQYVRQTLRPKMYEVLGPDVFIIEAMSTSYISRIVMENFKNDIPEFQYRRVTENARNPDFEANEMELEMMRYFAENPGEKDRYGIFIMKEGRYYMRFSPVAFDDSCLLCHGKPETAPKKILESYDLSRGFHKEAGKIGGVVSIAIPVETGLIRIKEIALSVFGTAFMLVFLLYGVICFFFNRVIIDNIRSILDKFWNNLTDAKGIELLSRTQSMDEIGELSAGAEVIARHLQDTQEQLLDYAENLEIKVARRTKALRESETLLKIKNKERGEELLTFNTITELISQSTSLPEILPQVLHQTLQVVPAEGAALYLLHHQKPLMELQLQENAPQLISQFFGKDIPPPYDKKFFDPKHTSEACSISDASSKFLQKEFKDTHCLHVPLCCRDQILGAMIFTGIDFEEIEDELKELLTSIGRQIGIMLENFDNITKLLRSKELLQSAFDGITDFVLLLDYEWKVTMTNRSLLQRYGFSEDMIRGEFIEKLSFLYPDPFMLFHKIASVQLKEPATDQIQLHTGKIFDINFYPVSDEEGSLGSIICIAKDITDRKLVEERIQRTEKLASIGQLAAGVAHEINNPLGIILCYADLLKEDLKDQKKQVEDIDIIEKNVRNCQRIVSDLVNFARDQKPNKTFASVNDTITAVVSMVENQFKKKNITIELVLAEDLPLLYIDADKMKQVYLNLIMNAAQAIKEKGTIEITAAHDKTKQKVQVSIKDDGEGIAREVLGRIFDPFFTTKEPDQGTGLGLSLSFGIIEDHEGNIEVSSEAGKGTIFTISLPCPKKNEVSG